MAQQLIQEQEFVIYNTTKSRQMFPGLIIPAGESRTTNDSGIFKSHSVYLAWRSGAIEITPDPARYFAGDAAIKEPGPGGGGGGSGDLNYVHPQPIVSASWVITHNLGKYPSVTVIDSAGSEIEGAVSYVNLNTIQIVFSAAFSGVAYLN